MRLRRSEKRDCIQVTRRTCCRKGESETIRGIAIAGGVPERGLVLGRVKVDCRGGVNDVRDAGGERVVRVRGKAEARQRNIPPKRGGLPRDRAVPVAPDVAVQF